MTRMIIISLLNLMLPFLLRAAWIYLQIVLHKRRVKKDEPRVIDVTPPEWDFPVWKLLAVGILLLALSLTFLRFSNEEIVVDDWRAANPAQNVEFK